MIFPIGLILLGTLLAYSGWTGKSFIKLLTRPGLSAPGPGAEEEIPDVPDEDDAGEEI